MTEDKTQQKAEELDLTALERVIAVGDLSKLTKEERFAYYLNVCSSIGLNPVTQPFKYMKLNGQLRLYATKDATDQLRRLHNISTRFDKPDKQGDVMYVKAHAKMPSGRTDEDVGAVAVGNSRGEALANLLMKCHTKAKRRATLGICGLGDFSDETEVETIPGAQAVDMTEAQGQAPTTAGFPEIPQPIITQDLGPYAVAVVTPPPESPPPARGLDPQGPPTVSQAAESVLAIGTALGLGPREPEPELVLCGVCGNPAIHKNADGLTFCKDHIEYANEPQPYDDTPIGFADEAESYPEPAGRPPPTDSQSVLVGAFVHAMRHAEDTNDLKLCRDRVMGLKFDTAELALVQEAYRLRKGELG